MLLSFHIRETIYLIKKDTYIEILDHTLVHSLLNILNLQGKGLFNQYGLSST